MKIEKWHDISSNFKNGCLIIGNGASIAIDKKFKYKNLYEYARDKKLLSEETIKVFEFFKNENFEFILRMLWHAYNINQALGIEEEDPINKAYEDIRQGLINAVKQCHADYSDVEIHFNKISDFIKNFRTVISLNYDLILYWSMMYDKDKYDTGHWLKDCFNNGTFQKDFGTLRYPYGDASGSTLVFYPHGNLILIENIFKPLERKIKRRESQNLLNILENEWTSEQIPLYVSEGNSELKKLRIEKSTYLRTVYENVLSNIEENVTIYGWSMSEEDNHIIDQIAKNNIKKIAISVYNKNNFDTSFLGKFPKEIQWSYFDSQSKDCWIY